MWNFKKYAERIAIIDDKNQKLTYKELNILGDAVAEKINERCLVFLLCTNRIASVIGYTAFLNHRIVPILLNAQIEEVMLKNLIEKYKPSYIWLPEERTHIEEFEVIYKNYGYNLLRAKSIKKIFLHKDLGLLLTTSGSTGSPKYVRQSYMNILENAKSIVQYLQLNDDERPITTLPMNYTYGLSIINSHLLIGATILLTDATLMQKEFWCFLKEEKATSFSGVPYTYEMLAKLRFFQMNLPDIRYITQAGGKLSLELHKQYAEFAQLTGKKFIVMYGQTEATARMGYLPAEYSLEKCGSIGIAIPGGKFTIIDTEGNIIDEADKVGELVYEGPNVALGYAECIEDLGKSNEWNGRLLTGDMAKKDRDGFYYIVGRKKRFLKIFGNRVNLEEIEILLRTHFENLEFACTGIDDHLCIYVTTLNERIHKEIKVFLIKVTNLNSIAFSVKSILEIPKNETGKIIYDKLEKF